MKSRTHHTAILALVFALLLGLAGCGKDSATPKGPQSVTSGNHTTTVSKTPQRIVSLSPTATESLYALGAGKSVVAVDAMSNYPQTAPVTTLSGLTPNIEAILSNKPDLVVAMIDAGGLVGAMTNANVPILIQPTANTLDEAFKQINDLGILLDRSSEAEKTVKSTQATIDAAVQRAAHVSLKEKYYYEVDPTFYSATSSSFVGSILARFPLLNIADTAQTEGNASAFPQLSSEFIVSANPSYIFLADAQSAKQSLETVKARPGWSHIEAVNNGRVIALNDDIASRWGPRIGELANSVADAIVATATTTTTTPATNSTTAATATAAPAASPATSSAA